MTQDFNLLGSAPRSAQRTTSANRIAIALAAVLVFGIASALWINWRADRAETRIAAANAAIEDLILRLQERSQFLAQRNADPALVGHLQQLERESTDKGRVLDLLSGRSLGNTAGFSAHLAALGRRHPRGLWLRNVVINEGGRQMAIRGRAISADLVPRFIEALQAEPAFRGTAFERFGLTHAPGSEGTVSFALSTACTTADEATTEDCFDAPPEDPS